MKRQLLTLSTAALVFALFTGCIEKELPIPQRLPNEINLVEANVGVDYETQLFYSLQSNQIESSCAQRDWCVALRATSGGTQLMVNSGRAMKTHRTGSSALNAAIDLDSIEWEVMEPSGANANDPQINHLALNQLTLVDLGLDKNNEPLGTARIGLLAIESEHWLLHVADSEGNNVDTLVVPMLDGCEWHQVSLIDRTPRQVEPPSQAWEICITQYMELLDGEIPYLVVGILTPTDRVRVFETSGADWDEWKINNWDGLEFSSDWNAIGFDWKTFNLGTSSYTIDLDKLYCIQTTEGREFMMRMLDFYDANGNTGNVTFEVLER